jgi:uracil-DNA glycosylase family protein
VADEARRDPKSLTALNKLIGTAKPMVQGGTRAVLGEGPVHPAIAFVGEQPGDQEDREGRPFVGPAGKLLNKALIEAHIDRKSVYVTNAVKHFKFEQRGKRRLHARPNAGEVKHYRWWLEKEIDFVDPKILVALGSTAALALSGKAIAVTKHRGPVMFGGRAGYITIHPSYLLRIRDKSEKRRAWKAFISDLKAIRVEEREFVGEVS